MLPIHTAWGGGVCAYLFKLFLLQIICTVMLAGTCIKVYKARLTTPKVYKLHYIHAHTHTLQRLRDKTLPRYKYKDNPRRNTRHKSRIELAYNSVQWMNM